MLATNTYNNSILGFWALLASATLILCAFVNDASAAPLSSERSVTGISANLTRLAKRFDGARFTFYDAGLGACGEVNSNSDFIVALNIAQWDNRAHCGERISISYGGKTATARITDLCPGCPYGGLDLSRGLFSYFASQDLGVIHGTWNFGSGGGGTAPRPTTTTTRRTTYAPSPTTRSSTTRPHSTTPTSTRAPPTQTPNPPTTSRTRPSITSTSTTPSTESTSALTGPTPSPAASASRDGEVNPDALQKLSFILLKLGAMIAEFAKANQLPGSS